jgi:hypothetical protein
LNSPPRTSRLLEGIALLLIVLSAILFQRSATAPWAEGRAADGRHLQVSPIGIADFGLGTTGTPATECRWWPKLGDANLCAAAPGGDAFMKRLRRAYPLVVAALWTSVLALFLNALRIPRRAPALGIVTTTVVPLLAVAALWSVAAGAKGALSVLANVNLQVVPRGFGSVFAGALLMAVAVGLLVLSKAGPVLNRDLRQQ